MAVEEWVKIKYNLSQEKEAKGSHISVATVIPHWEQVQLNEMDSTEISRPSILPRNEGCDEIWGIYSLLFHWSDTFKESIRERKEKKAGGPELGRMV